MKKILLIDDNFHSEKTGAPLFAMERKFLRERGCEVYTLSFGEVSSEAGDRDFFVQPNRSGRLAEKVSKFFGDEAIEAGVRDVVARVKPDVIHNHLVSKYPIPVFKGLPDDIPVVQTLHGPNFFCPTSWGNLRKDSSPCDLGCSLKCVTSGCIPVWQYPMIASLFGQIPNLLKKVSVFHCPSKNIESVVQSFGFANTCRIPLGLRPEFSNVPPKEIFLAKKLLFIGSLHPVKGLDYLLQAMVEIVESEPEISLSVAGRGDFLEYYKSMAKDLGVSQSVNFLGFVDKSKIIDLYRSADLTVVPSVWSEQFGMVGPESLACGTPVVGSNVGGVPEWLEQGKSGELVPLRDSNNLARTILRLLSDKEKLKAYSRFGQEKINQVHRYDQYASSIAEFLINV